MVVTVAAIGVSAASLAGGIRSNRKARRAAKKAAQISNLQAAARLRDTQINQLRQSRIARAESLAAAVASGSESSSASEGALSSIGSQTAYNVNYTAQDAYYQNMIDRYTRTSNKYSNQTSLYSQLFGVSTGIAAQGISNLDSSSFQIFGNGITESGGSITGGTYASYT